MTTKPFNPETDEIPEGYAAMEVGMNRQASKSLLMTNITTAAKEGPDQVIIDMMYQIALFCEMGKVGLSGNDLQEYYQGVLGAAVEQAPEVMEMLAKAISQATEEMTKH